MKKFWVLFGFPLFAAAVFVLCGTDFIAKTSRGVLAALNPLDTVKYIQKENPDGTDSIAESIAQLFPHTEAESESFANPFDGFDPDSPTSAETPIDTEYPIVETSYVSSTSNVIYRRHNCFVKNLTSLSQAEVEAELLAETAFKVEKHSDQPQILIMHTHATESYQNYPELFYDPEYSCRDTDVTKNMVSVGKIIADKLNELGYNTLHDATLHDYPSYNESYGRSKATVEQYLAQHPSIKVVLDVHRDAIERTDGTRVKPVITINGKKCAQVMIISGADNGYLNMPNYKKNLRFASHFQNAMETLYPGFTRPVLFDYRNYNQQLTTGSLLIEVGGHANTLEEAQNSAYLIAYSLANVFDSQQ